MPKNRGAAGQLIGPGKVGAKHDEAPRLREVGITHAESSRAQKLADIPEPEFRERIAIGKIGGKLSTAKVLRMPARGWPVALTIIPCRLIVR